MIVSDCVKLEYHRPDASIVYPNQFQAISVDDFVICSICGVHAGYVWTFVSDHGADIQLCGNCAHVVDGKKYFVGQ